MQKMFSHIVIFSLLMIAPVSFSTTEIPNFYILVTINSPLQESRKSSIAVEHRVVRLPEPSVAAITPHHRFILPPNPPTIDCIRDIEHGRPPPVVPSA